MRFKKSYIVALLCITTATIIAIVNWPFFVLFFDNFPPWPCEGKAEGKKFAARTNHHEFVADVLSRIPSAPAHLLNYSASVPGVIFATATSQNHFSEFQGLLSSFALFLSPAGHRLLVFDLGLSFEQIGLLKEYCSFCVIKSFPFDQYPPHVANLQVYAWKTLIINSLLRERRTVVWMDSSIRFTTSELSILYTYAEHNGVALYEKNYIHSALTHADMFRIFGADPCDFRTFSQIEANFMCVHLNSYTQQVLLPLWLACVLDPACVAPTGSRTWPCDLSRSPEYAGCHRFDQSALTLILYLTLYGRGEDYKPWVLQSSVAFVDRSAGADGYRFLKKQPVTLAEYSSYVSVLL